MLGVLVWNGFLHLFTIYRLNLRLYILQRDGASTETVG